jgi:hypothetical protein
MEMALVAVVGLVLSAVGVFLMVRYGLPKNLPILGVVLRALTQKDVDEKDRRAAWGTVGVVVFVAGTIVAAISLLAGGAF